MEHLIVGKKLDARVVDAMFAFHFPSRSHVKEYLQPRSRHMQQSVFLLRASEARPPGSAFLCVYYNDQRPIVYDDDEGTVSEGR